MSSGSMQAQAIERATELPQAIERAQATEQPQAIERAQATEQPSGITQAEQPPPMTAEAARRLAAILAPHLMAMRAVTAGTPYGACAGADPAVSDAAVGDPAAGDPAATSTAAAAALPPASAATKIFIAGMLERLSA